jgi:hypothetical protein
VIAPRRGLTVSGFRDFDGDPEPDRDFCCMPCLTAWSVDCAKRYGGSLDAYLARAAPEEPRPIDHLAGGAFFTDEELAAIATKGPPPLAINRIDGGVFKGSSGDRA